MITEVKLNNGQKRAIEDWMQREHPNLSGMELVGCDHYRDRTYRVRLVAETNLNKEHHLTYFVNMSVEENTITDIEFDS